VDLSAECFSLGYLRDGNARPNRMNTPWSGLGSRVRVEKKGE